jgi:hypothetical protein
MPSHLTTDAESGWDQTALLSSMVYLMRWKTSWLQCPLLWESWADAVWAYPPLSGREGSPMEGKVLHLFWSLQTFLPIAPGNQYHPAEGGLWRWCRSLPFRNRHPIGRAESLLWGIGRLRRWFSFSLLVSLAQTLKIPPTILCPGRPKSRWQESDLHHVPATSSCREPSGGYSFPFNKFSNLWWSWVVSGWISTVLTLIG